MTAGIALGVLLAHLTGDYLLQNDWMAVRKTAAWVPAVVHGVVYTLPHLVVTQSVWALLVIGGTHVVIDRFRLAKYVIFTKNLLAPAAYRTPWSECSKETGFPAAMPVGLATGLLWVVDNVIHLLINVAAVVWL
ncbi:DUF3307 domain-containing protein [Micromonospora sp. DT227]|uniref:DUF3307 domain-containing protein n=1 Tax=Micromonospora sp. DT227 TaxID=3393433 RepID=UPI003CE9CFD5